MKKELYLLSISILVLISASCSSDGDSAIIPPPKKPTGSLVDRIIETDPSNNTNTIRYSYKGNKLKYSKDDKGYLTEYFYDGDLLTQIEYWKPFDENNDLYTDYKTEFFAYDSNQKLISFKKYDHIDYQYHQELYTYDASGDISVTYYSGDNFDDLTLDGTGLIDFTDGEIISITTNLGSSVVKTYTYDNASNPFKNVIGLDKISFTDSETSGINHNVLTEVVEGDWNVFNVYAFSQYSDYPRFSTKVDSRVAGATTFQYLYQASYLKQ